MDTNRDAYHQKMTAQFNEWGAKVDVLRAKADKASAEAKIELHKKLDGIKELEKQAAAMLERVKTATGEAWTEVKKSVDEGWTKVAAAFDAAVDKGHEKVAEGAQKVADGTQKAADKVAKS